jgi:hypothetical protein
LALLQTKKPISEPQKHQSRKDPSCPAQNVEIRKWSGRSAPE